MVFNTEYLHFNHIFFSTNFLREMHLEDGRFLVAHQRYDSLDNPSSDLIRVHPDFWVIALGG